MSPLGVWIWLFGPRTTELRTRLSADECFQRLNGAVVSRWAWFVKGEVSGWVRQRDAWVRRRQFWRRNSFQSVMKLKWEPDGLKTVIVCRCGMMTSTAVFMALWLGAVCLVAISIGVQAYRGSIDLVGVLVPVVMPVAGVAVMVFGRVLALGD